MTSEKILNECHFFYDDYTQGIKDIVEFVIPYKLCKKEEVKNICKDYMAYYDDLEAFEKASGMSIDDYVNGDIAVLYERYIKLNADEAYDWGDWSYRLYNKGGRGAKKVWVLLLGKNKETGAF